MSSGSGGGSGSGGMQGASAGAAFGPWGAAIGGAGGALMGFLGSRGAANTQEAAAAAQRAGLQHGFDYMQGMYGQGVAAEQPYLTGGSEAMGALETFAGLPGGQGQSALDAYNQYTKTPYYTFPLQQMTDTIGAQAAAHGTYLSGGRVGALTQMAGNYASQQFQSYINNLQKLAGGGQTAASDVARMATTFGGEGAGMLSQMGNVTAGGMVNAANLRQNALGQLPVLGANLADLGKLAYDKFAGQTGSSLNPTGAVQPMPMTGAATGPMSSQYNQAQLGQV